MVNLFQSPIQNGSTFKNQDFLDIFIWSVHAKVSHHKIFDDYNEHLNFSLDQFTDVSLAYSMWQGPQPGVLFNSGKNLKMRQIIALIIEFGVS